MIGALLNPHTGPLVALLFVLTTFGTIFLFLRAIASVNADSARTVGILILLYVAIQGGLAYFGFYLDFESFPPRFIFAAGPALLVIIVCWILPIRKSLRLLPLEDLTYLHVVRVPVEIGLWLLFLAHQVPQLMTFEGINYDILAGLTAPVIAWFCFTRRQWPAWLALVWNLLALILVLNIVIHAVLSAPLPFQQFAFEQPNIAVFYFPYIWLPSIIVPIVLLSHLISIRKLLGGDFM